MGAITLDLEMLSASAELVETRPIWHGGKPKSTRELMDFMASRGLPMNPLEAANFLYAFGGMEHDLRDFNRILNAPDPRVANDQALGRMYFSKFAQR